MFWKNFADLLKVKTIVTFIVVGVYAALALRGDIQPSEVDKMTMIVVAFYFGTQADRKRGQNA